MKDVIKTILRENLIGEYDNGYSQWKRKNVTLRGMKEMGVQNGVYGSFGKGLYTVPLSNRAMARQYGDVYFVVNGIPKNPKIVQSLNMAEIFRYELEDKFCKENGMKHDSRFFHANTSMEIEMLKLGYDGLVIKGREMVNYNPENVKYFRTEYELKIYYDNYL